MLREQQLLTMTVAGLEASLERHMPPGAYRQYYQWALSSENPYQAAFHQAQGITQLVNMTCKLLQGLVKDDLWADLAPHTVPMNVYQIYEIVSDNLAIGMAKATASDGQFRVRRTLLHEFNRVMIEKLKGDERPAPSLLKRAKALTRQVSIFDQSLNPRKQRSFAHVYVEQHQDFNLETLEYSAWPVLTANIESCVDMARTMYPYQSHTLISRGLINRYRAVNHLLKHETLNRKAMLEASTYAILVIPTLAYYIGILGEVVQPNERFGVIIGNNMLSKALYDAALLVRLLNDLGTWTLRLTPEQHQALATVLQLRYHHYTDSPNFASALQMAIQDTGVLTRIHKDIQHEEFNVSLYSIREADFQSDAIQLFTRNLAYFSQVYLKGYQRLQSSLSSIEDNLQDDWIGNLIMRFVHFHEMLYSNPYDVQEGEYSV